MHKKDYELIANVLVELPRRTDKVEVVSGLCKAFVNDNPLFDVDKFIAASLGLVYTPHPLDFKDVSAVAQETNKEAG